MKCLSLSCVLLWLAGFSGQAIAATADSRQLVESVRDGNWSDVSTWQGGRLPTTGDRVLVRPGHRVQYDIHSDAVLRSVFVGGTLSFAPDRDTRMDVGLLIVRPGMSVAEDGIDHALGHAADLPDSHGSHPTHHDGLSEAAAGNEAAAHARHAEPSTDTPNEARARAETHQKEAAETRSNATGGFVADQRPALEIGTAARPIEAAHHATIRLTYIEGMDRNLFPALVASGGRLDIHGAAMERTWTKLGEPAQPGDTRVTLVDSPQGWRVGDKVIVVTTAMIDLFAKTPDGKLGSVKDNSQTEERTVVAIEGRQLTLDAPLRYPHTAQNEFRGEVANLSRNVVIETADLAGPRGHTMYHSRSAGSISYAEFRHLGKEGVLARYPIHFHLCGDTMRGSSVVGASVWDSGNRWVTVHGTEYLVVRDVVGYRGVGHGFFLEDGTEVYNVFDRNLAVQALRGKPLPEQALAFDKNDGGGFWWANSRNTFTRNCAAECDQHGYRYEVVKNDTFDPTLRVRQSDGTRKPVDIRTLPFVRFDDNEAHSQRRFGLNLGGIRAIASSDDYQQPPKINDKGEYTSVSLKDDAVKGGDVGGVGPDRSHPFIIRNLKLWTSHWAFHGGTPSVYIDGLRVNDSNYGIWRSRVDLNEYLHVSISNSRRVDIFFPWGGNPSIQDDYDRLLKRVDDLPPTTVITQVETAGGGALLIRGVTADNGDIKDVQVNGVAARATAANFSQWEATLPQAKGVAELVAFSTDKAGNVEQTPHHLPLAGQPVAAAATPESESLTNARRK